MSAYESRTTPLGAPAKGEPAPGSVAARPAPAPSPPPLGTHMYRDPGVLEQELRAIFARSWQYACHVSQLGEPGRYRATYAGDQPLLVLRTHDGELRAYRNVCRHRGSELLSGAGTTKKAIRCRYHGWTYDAGTGRLLGVPEHRTYSDLDKAKLGLYPAAVTELGGLVFANCDPHAAPLAGQVAGLAELLERYRVPELTCFASGDSGSQPANWKVVADNYLEGYHIPIAHPGLMRLFDYQRYDLDLHENYARFDAPLRDKPSENRSERLYQRLVRPMPGLDGSDRRSWRYVFLYPNTTIDFYPDQVNVWKIMPDGVGRTADRWACFRAPGAGPLTRFVQRLNHRLNTEVQGEDVGLVGGVQRGIASHDYAFGPLSAREAAIGWFAQKVRDDLARAGSR